MREHDYTSILQQWQVLVEHPGQPSLQHYQVAVDKTLISIQLKWRGRLWCEIRALLNRKGK